jgi:hypothetical protein
MRCFPPYENDAISTFSKGLLYSHYYQFILRGDILAEEQGKCEETAEKTGKFVGKGLKKGFGVVKAVGKGTKDAVTEKKE